MAHHLPPKIYRAAMPMTCEECGSRIEVYQPYTLDPDLRVTCPQCAATEARKAKGTA